ncbi:Spermine synthase [Verrucomicrobia bacterium]|nr:Spermine synthase [Verrucomicrobiota bacterium]
MQTMNAYQPSESSRPQQSLLALLLLFFGSGCAALIYEIVWLQMLQLVLGSSAVSLAVLLGTFMGGMCLGSLVFPRVVSRRWHPLRAFAVLEAGVGVLGLAVLLLVPALARVYIAGAGAGLPALGLRGAVAALCLLPPTVLMGATLPAISRWVELTPHGVSRLGWLYAGNLAGAVFGCLLAGFYLLRVHNLETATCFAAVINGLVACAAVGLAALPGTNSAARDMRAEGEGARTEIATDKPIGTGMMAVYLAIGISGFCALSAEVVWTRLLSLMLGATVYTFSIILAVFLAGLGLGGNLGARLGGAVGRSRLRLGYCQWLLAATVALAAYLLCESLPYWPINPTLARSPWLIFQLDLLRCAWAILPSAVLWGASFALALGCVGQGPDPARLVGKIYAANTLGAIVGAVSASLMLIPVLGTQESERLLVVLSAVAGGLVLACSGALRPRTILVGLLLGAAAVVVLVRVVPPVPWELVAYGRYLPAKLGTGTKLFVGEGINASVAVTQLSDGERIFHVSGKAEASTGPRDMRVERMLGHLPALLHERPRTVLVVGCGAGVTAGSFTTYPAVERIVLCEIEPLIPKVVASYFAQENHHVMQDARLRLVYDDARHFVLTTREKFDVITSDPIHPWVKGAATLYTKEYFQSCRQHLNPGGLVSQWVPLYESTAETVKSEIATFFEVFPAGTIWSNDEAGAGYDVVLLGEAEPLRVDVGQIQKRLNSESYERVARSLREAGFRSALSLLGTYAGRAADLAPWLEHAEINRDKNLRLQYLAGWGLNRYDQEALYSQMASYRRFPEDIFVGKDEWGQALRRALSTAESK